MTDNHIDTINGTGPILIRYMAGLPRSGSTLLSALLNQHPDIHSSANSPMCGMLFNLERSILASEQYRADPRPRDIPAAVMGVINGYYARVTKPIVIDKSREWAMKEHLGVLLRNCDDEPRVILPVRTITDILASFITLVHNSPPGSFIDQEIEARGEFNFYRELDDIRCDHLMRPKGLIDNCLYGIAYAMLEENQRYFHIVEYDAIVKDPQGTLDGITDFIGADRFTYDLRLITNVTPEDDAVFGLPGMHDVRMNISPSQTSADVLSPYVRAKYAGLELWR